MAIITGGAVTPKGVLNAGQRPPIYFTDGVPTDGAVSSLFTAANGDIAINVANGDVYERAAGVWARRDTL
jgi:hypothetical protein